MKYVKPTIEVVKLELESAILTPSTVNNQLGEGVQYSKRNNFDYEDEWEEEEEY